MAPSEKKNKLSYASAGVDIKAGDDAVERIKSLARKTFGDSVLFEIGSFGGFFRPKLGGLASPVLISSADGVGTKLKFAFLTDRHDSVGEDLVNHCVNDILVHGAKPLFFLDYIATGKLKPDTIAEIVEGLSRGCQNCGMALLGGETAEMPDFYQPGEYDLAGFIVGMVDEKKIVNGQSINDGDICIGLPSNGLHTNGYTLARKIIFEVARLNVGDYIEELSETVAEAFMKVHVCYEPAIRPLLENIEINGMAHITGGGIGGNLKRIIPDGLCAEISLRSWPVPPVFTFLQARGGVETGEMYSAFNMGMGFILVVGEAHADKIQSELSKSETVSYKVGRIVKGKEKVRMI